MRGEEKEVHFHCAFSDKPERNCHFPAGTARLTAMRYKFFPVLIKYRTIKTIKSTDLDYKRC
jgi:hypothetical protein